MAGQNHTIIGIYGVHTVFLAGTSPYIRSNRVHTYGSGQPEMHALQSVSLLLVRFSSFQPFISGATSKSVVL